MARKYYTLYIRDEEGHWHHEFGDYEKKVVVSEQEDWLDHYDDNGKRRLKKNTLIKTWDPEPTQADLTAFLKTL